MKIDGIELEEDEPFDLDSLAETRFLKLLIEEREEGIKKLLWMSFANEEGFLGVILVECYGFSTGLLQINKLGINPGGEVQGLELQVDAIDSKHHNKLMNKEYLIEHEFVNAND